MNEFKTKKGLLILVLFISLQVVLTAGLWAKETIGARHSQSDGIGTAITVRMDPRVELLSVIFHLAGNREYNMRRFHLYNKAVDDHFGKFKDHEAVKLAIKLRATRGISYDAVMKMAVFIDDPFGLKGRIPLEPNIHQMDERWRAADAEAFLTAARKFVKDSNFKVFLQKHRSLMESSAAKLESVIRQYAQMGWFNQFFGKKPGSRFIITTGLLNGGANYGASIKLADGTTEMYSIIGVESTDDAGMAKFHAGVVNTVVHEFCHSYANPLVDRYADQLSDSGQKIFPNVAEQMKKQAYANWKVMMYESLVRAATIRYVHRVNGAWAAGVETHRNVKRGFLWIGKLAEQLARYENERETYPNLDSFMPQVVAFFNDYAGSIKRDVAGMEKKKTKKEEWMKRKGPQIVSITPADGTRDVDPGLKTIVVVFDRAMKDKCWSVMRTGGLFPAMDGVFYDENRKIFTMKVRLESGKTYEYGLNAPDYYSFQSEEGVPLFPVKVSFKTK